MPICFPGCFRALSDPLAEHRWPLTWLIWQQMSVQIFVIRSEVKPAGSGDMVPSCHHGCCIPAGSWLITNWPWELPDTAAQGWSVDWLWLGKWLFPFLQWDRSSCLITFSFFVLQLYLIAVINYLPFTWSLFSTHFRMIWCLLVVLSNDLEDILAFFCCNLQHKPATLLGSAR